MTVRQWLVGETQTSSMQPDLDDDDLRLLGRLSKYPRQWPTSPAEAASLIRLVVNGYVIADPQADSPPTLTVRGWAALDKERRKRDE